MKALVLLLSVSFFILFTTPVFSGITVEARRGATQLVSIDSRDRSLLGA